MSLGDDMPAPYSGDLRQRVAAAVAEGLSGPLGPSAPAGGGRSSSGPSSRPVGFPASPSVAATLWRGWAKAVGKIRESFAPYLRSLPSAIRFGHADGTWPVAGGNCGGLVGEEDPVPYIIAFRDPSQSARAIWMGSPQMMAPGSELIIYRAANEWHVVPKSSAPDKLPALHLEFDIVGFAKKVLDELGVTMVAGTADDFPRASDAQKKPN